MIKFRHGCRMGTLLGSGLLLGSLVMAQWSAAATYYVAPDGNDANEGTIDEPYRTVKAGVGVLNPGDTLYLRAGTYQESLVNVIPGGQSWDNPVTIKAHSGETVTLRPSNTSSAVLYFSASGSQYIVIDGLSLDEADNPLAVVYVVGSAHHIRLVNCELKNSRFAGLYGGRDSEFINLNVHDNGLTEFHHGLYITGGNNLVEGSQVYHNAGWGVHIYTGTGSGADDNIVRDNEIYENAGAGARGNGILLSSGTGNSAEGNRIWSNQNGIQIDYGSVGAQVSNNEIYDNQRYGIYIGPGSRGAVVHDNDVHDNSWGDSYDLGS